MSGVDRSGRRRRRSMSTLARQPAGRYPCLRNDRVREYQSSGQGIETSWALFHERVQVIAARSVEQPRSDDVGIDLAKPIKEVFVEYDVWVRYDHPLW